MTEESYGAGSLATLLLDVMTSEPWQPDAKEQKRIIYHDYINSLEWKITRDKALYRAGRKCQLCGSTARLEVHHNTYARLGDELPTDLIVLCDGCHRKYHDEPTD